jgi:hypothetical protein
LGPVAQTQEITMNTIALTGTEHLPAARPGARPSADMLSFARAALEATAVIGASFVVALAVMTVRVLATAHMAPGFHDALAGTLPFLG